jgi:hypothetical protein
LTPGGTRIHFWGNRYAVAAAITVATAACAFTGSAAGSGQAPDCYNPSQEVEHGEDGQIHFGCWDPEYDALTVTVTQQPAHGTLTGPDSNKVFHYRTDGPYTGPDEFRYTVTDGSSPAKEVTAHVTVAAARNDPPWCSAGVPADIEAGDPHPVWVSCYDDEGAKVTPSLHEAPDHGTLAGPTEYGGWTYTPHADYTGPDSMSFVGSDGTHESQPATAELTVVARRNDPPDCYSVWRYPAIGPPGADSGPLESGEKASWFAQCADDEGDKLSARVVEAPQHGVAEPGEYNSVSYTAGTGYNGPDGFKFVMDDGPNDSQQLGVSVDVREARDDPPSCAPINLTIEQGDFGWVGPSCFDDEQWYEGLQVEVVAAPSHGTIDFSGFGSRVYTPDPDYVGPDQFTLRVTDDGGNAVEVPGTVEVVASENDPPTCYLMWVSGNGGSFAGGAGQVEHGETQQFASNCFDDEYDPVVLEVSRQPEHGSLTVMGNTVRYTANDDGYTGSDTFGVRGDDGRELGPETTQTVTIIEEKDDLPVCQGMGRGGFMSSTSTVEAGERDPITVWCWDDEGAAVTTSVTQEPAHGAIEVDDLGNMAYKPDDGYTGSDSFKFKGTTGAQDTSEVTVNFNVVAAANGAPQCHLGPARYNAGMGPGGFSAEAGEELTLVASCMDDEADKVTFTVTDEPDHGSLEVVPDRPRGYPFGFEARVRYTPDPDHRGPDSFKLKGSDGTNETVEIAAQLQVVDRTDDAPTCGWRSGFIAAPGEPVTIDLSNACSDDEGEPLDFEVTKQPRHGQVSGPDEQGRFTYESEDGFEGSDAMTVTASDGTNTSAPHVVDVFTGPGYTAYTPGAQCYGAPVMAMAPNGTLALGADDLCRSDATGHRVMPFIKPPAHGTLEANADGTVRYTPEPGFSGYDTFGVRIDDGERIVGEQTVRVEVGGPPNAAPVCTDTSMHVLRGTVTPVPLRCSDADGDGVHIERVSGSGPSHGRLGPIDSDGGTVMYRPFASFVGEDLFQFQADDGRSDGFSAPATARLVVVADGASRDVAPGEEVSTGESASTSDPLIASVTSPVGGRVAVFEGAPAGDAPAGYSFLGQQVSVQAPRASAESPLKLVFELDASLIPPGTDPAELTLFRNDAPVGACTGPAGQAVPTPCLAARELLVNGNLRLTVFTVEASRWNLGLSSGEPPGGGNPPGGGEPPAGGDPGPGPGDPGPGPGGPGPGDPGPGAGPGELPPPPPGGGNEADRTAPSVKLSVKKGQKLAKVLSKGLLLNARCSEACAVSATLSLDSKLAKRLRIPAKAGGGKVTLAGAGSRALTVKLTKAARKALARSARVTLTVSGRAVDLSQNVGTAKVVKAALRR